MQGSGRLFKNFVILPRLNSAALKYFMMPRAEIFYDAPRWFPGKPANPSGTVAEKTAKPCPAQRATSPARFLAQAAATSKIAYPCATDDTPGALPLRGRQSLRENGFSQISIVARALRSSPAVCPAASSYPACTPIIAALSPHSGSGGQ